MVNLVTLTGDADRDRLTFFLPYAASSGGAALTLHGSTVHYAPSQAGITDGFVYGVSDGRGGVSAGVVVVDVISGVPR